MELVPYSHSVTLNLDLCSICRHRPPDGDGATESTDILVKDGDILEAALAT